MASRKLTINVDYQDTIFQCPIPQGSLYQQAASNDGVTVESWKDIWISQAKANSAVFGPFKDRSIGKLLNKHRHSPIFVVGSGPSLKQNAHKLKGNHGIPIISCLHNFHFLEDLGVNVDYYVSLDAGPVTIEEVSEGGDPTVDYWEKTRGKTLLAYIGSHPNLLAKWQGEILFFNCLIPNMDVQAEMDKIERFKVLVSSGGNVLGACLYIAKAFLGCRATIFLGADFSFSNDGKFHAWDSKYDHKLGQYISVTNIFGFKVKTWRSYANFKAWFDWVAQAVPGEYINCTEGGIFGAYNEGNIFHIKQMDLDDCLKGFCLTDNIKEQVENPETQNISILF